MLDSDRKDQKEKFASMNFKDKADYIWTYYKIIIIASAVILLGIVYMIATPSKPDIETSVNITFIGEWVNQKGAGDFALQLNRDLPDLSGNDRLIDVQTYSLGETADPMMVMGNIQKLAANIMSSELDVVVGDAIQLKKYAEGEAFLPLSELYSKEELAGMDIVSEGSVEYINLSGKKTLHVMVPHEKIGMAVMANSLHTEEARAVMDYLLSLD